MLGKNIKNESIGKFKRKYYIKDLLNDKLILSSFSLIEFEDVETFIDLLIRGVGLKDQTIVLNIDDVESFLKLKEVMERAKINDRFKLIIFTDIVDDLFSNGLNEMKISIYTQKPVNIYNYFRGENKEIKDWIRSNILGYRLIINKDNLQTINQVGYNYVSNMLRFIWLEFDYISLNKISFDEFQKVEFWLNHLINWVQTSKDISQINIFKQNFGLKCYIDSNHNVCYSRNSPPIFNLDDIQNKDGNIAFRKLSKIRKLIDLEPKVIYTPINLKKINWYWVDLYANKQLMGYINEIPLITSIIMKLLEVIL